MASIDLRELAYSRSGDKGDLSNVVLAPFDEADIGQAAATGRSTVQATHGYGCEQCQLDARPAGPFPLQHARRHPRQRIKQRAAPAARLW